MRFRIYGPLALSALCATLSFVSARADDGPWEVRLRGVYLDPANKSDAITGLAPADAIHINGKWLPDLDFEYFFTPNWSSELVLTYPQSQTVTVGGTAIGTFKHLPPVLTAKYNFLPEEAFQPYLGVGVNLTLISHVDLAVPKVGKLDLSSSSVGPALQAGFDYKLADHWYFNADVKWFKLKSDVDLVGTGKVSTVHIDPFLFGIGFGYRFGGHAAAVAAPVAVAAPLVVAPPPPPPPPPAPAPTLPPPPVAKTMQMTDEVVLKGVNFETASARLTADSPKVLDEVVDSLKQRPDSTAEVRGYTDSVGKPSYNQSLSQRRAQSVLDYLVAHGIPASQLSARGLGPENPVASNETAEGRKENRRVTIQFTRLVPR